MQRIIISLPDDVLEVIDKLAEDDERSRSAYIRRVLIADARRKEASVTTGSTEHRIAQMKTQLADIAAREPHKFKPQAKNALKCDVCGLRKVDH